MTPGLTLEKLLGGGVYDQGSHEAVAEYDLTENADRRNLRSHPARIEDGSGLTAPIISLSLVQQNSLSNLRNG